MADNVTLEKGQSVRIGKSVRVTISGFSVEETRSGRLIPRVTLPIEAAARMTVGRGN